MSVSVFYKKVRGNTRSAKVSTHLIKNDFASFYEKHVNKLWGSVLLDLFKHLRSLRGIHNPNWGRVPWNSSWWSALLPHKHRGTAQLICLDQIYGMQGSMKKIDAANSPSSENTIISLSKGVIYEKNVTFVKKVLQRRQRLCLLI